MSSTFNLSDIQSASAYWYERIPYTLLLSTLQPNTAQSIFTTSGWNRGNLISTVVLLESLAATQQANLRFDLTYDRQAKRFFGNGFGSNLRPSEVGAYAINNISLTSVNTDSSHALVNMQINYHMVVWQMPISYKVMLGVPLTQNELDTARRIGLSTDPTAQKGTFPIPISAVVERTYANRLIDAPLVVADEFQATAQSTVFHVETAQTNQLLVLRNIAAEANMDYGVTITVDRDDNAGHVVLQADSLDLERGIDMFVPALHSLTFRIQAQTPPPYMIPVRVVMWRIAMSNILRVRTGQLTLAQLQTIMGSSAGQKFWDDVLAGVS